MIQLSLRCLKQQQAEFMKSSDPQKVQFAKLLLNTINKLEDALRDKGSSLEQMLERCYHTLQTEGWLITRECMRCAETSGCVYQEQLKASCNKVCFRVSGTPPDIDPKTAPSLNMPTLQQTPSPAKSENDKPEPKSSPDATSPNSAGQTNIEILSPNNRQKLGTGSPQQPVGNLQPTQFCNLLIEQQITCLQQQIAQLQKEGKTPDVIDHVKQNLEQIQKHREQQYQNCVKGIIDEQKIRAEQKRSPLSGQKLYACWLCLQKAGCASNSMQSCRALCAD
jgi:hypothetical protein